MLYFPQQGMNGLDGDLSDIINKEVHWIGLV